MASPTIADRGVLRFLTCGSVDDGKSTLIGRLLLDAKAILADALDALETSSRRRGLDGVDLSLVTDGLEAEREQGITIDVAYRYFGTGRRAFILADAPGHEIYTRNMVTAASTADLAIVLVDARKGILPQTRRHMTVLRLMGLRQVVVAINKMDLVGWSEAAFGALREEAAAFAARLGLDPPRFLPVSALHGDMVVERGRRLDWYGGPTLMELLETADLALEGASGPFRFPVQLVCRPRAEPRRDYRAYLGRVESGRISAGEGVAVLPGGLETRVARIERFGEVLGAASAGQSIALVLADDVDAARGDLIAAGPDRPAAVREIEADLCWLGASGLDPAARLLLRHGTREVRARVEAIHGRLDLETLELRPTASLALNDIACARVRLQQPIAPDPYRRLRCGGAFILVEEATNATVAAGMVLDPASSGAGRW